MHSEYKLKAKPQTCAPRVCGIRQHANNTRRRRVSGWVMKKLQKGAWPQKPVLPAKAARACFRRFFAAPTPSAALASQLCKFPRAKRQPATCASSPERNTSHQIGMHPPTPYPTFSKIYPARRAKCDHALRSMPSSRVSQLVAGNRSSSAVSFKANVPRSTWASTAR